MRKFRFFRKGKKGIELDALGWLIIGVLFLIIGIAVIIVLKG